MTDAHRFAEHETMITGDELARMPDRGPCELVVEILSPDNPQIDTMQKVREYLAIGVQLVLIVDPPSRSITAYRPAGGRPQLYGEGEAVPCGDVLPGFEVPVAAAFE